MLSGGQLGLQTAMQAMPIEYYQVHFWRVLPLQVAIDMADALAVVAVARQRAVLAVGRIVLSVLNVHFCAFVPLQEYVHTFWPVTNFEPGTSRQLPSTRSEPSAGNRVSACAFVPLQSYVHI